MTGHPGTDFRTLAEAMRAATIALSTNPAVGQQRGLDPTAVFRPALVEVGARPQDLDLHHTVRTSNPHWSQNPPETSAQALMTTLTDYAMAGIDTTALSLRDAIAWAVVTCGEDDDLATVATWTDLTPHGWLMHAAGLTPHEAAARGPVDLDRLYAMAALRNHFVPSWAPGETLRWPREAEPPHQKKA